MKLIYCVLLLLCPYCSWAQPLDVGAMLPLQTVKPVYNTGNGKLVLAPKKGSIRILHFLATGCKPCIAFVKKWQEMQLNFGDSLQILLVTREPLKKIEAFQKKLPGYFGNIPFGYNDTALEKIFPYQSVSHLVWINDVGKVVAITDSYYATEKNIRLVLKGIEPNWPVKKDMVGFNKQLPLFTLNAANIPYSSSPAFNSHSSFTAHMPDLPTTRIKQVDSLTGIQRITLINQTIPNLYLRTLRMNNFPASQIIINAPEKHFFVPDQQRFLKAGWELYNSYCYELVAPLHLSDSLVLQKMLADIQFHTGTVVTIKDSLMACYVLQELGVATKKAVTLWQADTSLRPLDGIIINKNREYFSIPIIDERSQKANIYIEWNLPINAGLTHMNDALAPYGLTLLATHRKMPVLLIHQQSAHLFSHSPKLYAK